MSLFGLAKSQPAKPAQKGQFLKWPPEHFTVVYTLWKKVSLAYIHTFLCNIYLNYITNAWVRHCFWEDVLPEGHVDIKCKSFNVPLIRFQLKNQIGLQKCHIFCSKLLGKNFLVNTFACIVRSITSFSNFWWFHQI